jgi:hypothetical protein
VQSAREAARRSSCSNNLKQIGIGLHNYHDTYKVFPSGWVFHAPLLPAVERQSWGWSALLLPPLEQAGLWQQIDFNVPIWNNVQDPVANPLPQPDRTSNLWVCQRPLEVFRCPSDLAPRAQSRNNLPMAGVGQVLNQAITSYRGNAGSQTGYSGLGTTMSTGVMFPDSNINIKVITDGTSNTIAVGEVAWRVQYFGQPPVQRLYGATASTGSPNPALAGGTAVDTNYGHPSRSLLYCGQFKMNQPVPLVAPAMPPAGTEGLDAASSFHEAGAQFLMCDGAVRFLNESIDHTATDWSALIGPGMLEIRLTYENGQLTPAMFGVYQQLHARADGLSPTF